MATNQDRIELLRRRIADLEAEIQAGRREEEYAASTAKDRCNRSAS